MANKKAAHKPRRSHKRAASRKKKRGFRAWHWLLVTVLVVLGGWLGFSRSCKALRPVPAGARIDGIDVSHHQGEINWFEVAGNSDVHFVYVKATEGATWSDDFFAENVWQAREEGLHVGAYLLYSPTSSPEAQFRYFVNFTQNADLDLIPCIDVEEDVDRQGLKANVLAIISLMEEHYGRKPLLYVNAHVYNDYFHPEAADCELWIPNYSRKPVLKGDERPFLWQYSETGRLEGIDEYVDLDCLANGMTVERLLMR